MSSITIKGKYEDWVIIPEKKIKNKPKNIYIFLDYWDEDTQSKIIWDIDTEKHKDIKKKYEKALKEYENWEFTIWWEIYV